jgi:hypothetical protein
VYERARDDANQQVKDHIGPSLFFGLLVAVSAFGLYFATTGPTGVMEQVGGAAYSAVAVGIAGGLILILYLARTPALLEREAQAEQERLRTDLTHCQAQLDKRADGKRLLHQLVRLRDFAVNRLQNNVQRVRGRPSWVTPPQMPPIGDDDYAAWCRLCDKWNTVCKALLATHGLEHHLSTLGNVTARADPRWPAKVQRHYNNTLERLDRLRVLISLVEERVIWPSFSASGATPSGGLAAILAPRPPVEAILRVTEAATPVATGYDVLVRVSGAFTVTKGRVEVEVWLLNRSKTDSVSLGFELIETSGVRHWRQVVFGKIRLPKRLLLAPQSQTTIGHGVTFDLERPKKDMRSVCTLRRGPEPCGGFAT